MFSHKFRLHSAAVTQLWSECCLRVFHSDPLAQYDEAPSNVLLVPALRFCGQLAMWTGNCATDQVQTGLYTVSLSLIINVKP